MSVDLLRFVSAVDVALCLLIALEIIKNNKGKALSFFFLSQTPSLLFPQLERNLCWLWVLLCAHWVISEGSSLPPAEALIILPGWYFIALLNELLGETQQRSWWKSWALAQINCSSSAQYRLIINLYYPSACWPHTVVFSSPRGTVCNLDWNSVRRAKEWKPTRT